ncbi:MAG TPA: ABC transporter ATP-binding protein [Candidatus Dormibacteraeota bacterium]|jgi:ABC-2 type transport system ATP-binding protein
MLTEYAAATSSPTAIEVDGVWKKFRLYREKNVSLKEAVVRRRRSRYEDFWALQDVSVRVPAGQALGLIGANGSGKSTLLKVIARILAADRGRVAVAGRVATLLELGAGFQMDYTGIENIYLNGAILGLSRRQITERLQDIIDFAELDQFINNPVRNYSSGMYMRLGFAIAVHVDPQVILIDEVLAVGDEAFQRKCIERIRQFRKEGRTMVFVSHDLAAVMDVCDRVLWLEHGRVRADGKPSDAVDAYLGHVSSAAPPAHGQENRAGPAQMPAVRISQSNGKVGFQFKTGGPMKIAVDYEFVEPVLEPFFGVSIFRNDGVYCYGINTRMDNIKLRGEPHRGTVELTFPELPLLPGNYEISLGFFDRDSRPLIFQHKQYAIRVRADQVNEGLMVMPHHWDVTA